MWNAHPAITPPRRSGKELPPERGLAPRVSLGRDVMAKGAALPIPPRTPRQTKDEQPVVGKLFRQRSKAQEVSRPGGVTDRALA
jgi:hypothetical protein